MDDSKLLELAGKAAGETYDLVNRNPLERDDLALRLAVKLGLEVDIGESCCVAYKRKSQGMFEEHFRDRESDPYAATRRAIVRAAAALEEPHHAG